MTQTQEALITAELEQEWPGACADCDGVCCPDDLRCPDCERAVKEEARIKQFWIDFNEGVVR